MGIKRSVLLMASVASGALLASGVALAANIECPNRGGNLCVGTPNRDTMTGTQRSDDMRGRAGKDTISARAGNDKLAGNDGDDVLRGGGNDDTYLFANGWGDDRIPGSGEGGGIDTLDFSAVTSPMKVKFERGRFAVWPSKDILDFPSARIENFLSGRGDDMIFGNNASNTISGGRGGDEIRGASGNDHLLGNLGLDELRGEEGNDRLEGGNGSDDYEFWIENWGSDILVDSATDESGESARNTLVLGPVPDQGEFFQAVRVDLVSSPDRPEVVNESGEGRVNWSGNAITDVFMQSDHAADTVKGNALNNNINVDEGSDTVYGRGGDDVIDVRDVEDADDVVDCGEDGPGITDADTVYANTGDTLIDCETVKR